MDLPKEAKRAPSTPVWNQSLPYTVQSVQGAVFRNIPHNLLGVAPRQTSSIRRPEEAVV